MINTKIHYKICYDITYVTITIIHCDLFLCLFCSDQFKGFTAGTRRQNDVRTMWLQRFDVATTSIQRHSITLCGGYRSVGVWKVFIGYIWYKVWTSKKESWFILQYWPKTKKNCSHKKDFPSNAISTEPCLRPWNIYITSRVNGIVMDDFGWHLSYEFSCARETIIPKISLYVSTNKFISSKTHGVSLSIKGGDAKALSQ